MDQLDAINQGLAARCADGVQRVVDGLPGADDEQRATILRLTANKLVSAAAELESD